MTKLKLAQTRNFNKKRLLCIKSNLNQMIENDFLVLTGEEQDSIQNIIKTIAKLLSVWPKTVNHN